MVQAVQVEFVGLFAACWWLVNVTAASSCPAVVTLMLCSVAAESLVVP